MTVNHNKLSQKLDYLQSFVAARVFRHMAMKIHGEDMSFSQINAIYLIYRTGHQTIAGIAKGADLSHNAASRMVDQMVRSGFATRVENPDDRRQKMVMLTEKGLDLLRDLQSVTISSFEQLFKDIPDAVLQRFDESLEEICHYCPEHPMKNLPLKKS